METAWLFLKSLGREALEKPDILRNVFTQWGAGERIKIILDQATQAKRGTAIVQMQGVDQVILCWLSLRADNASAGPAHWHVPRSFLQGCLLQTVDCIAAAQHAWYSS